MEALVKDPKQSSPSKASPKAGIYIYIYDPMEFLAKTSKPLLYSSNKN